MPETPLPQTLVDEPDDQAGPAESRQRKRTTTPSTRPVSAFAPARTQTKPEPQGQLTPEDCAFVTALHEAGVVSELDGAELQRAARQMRSETLPARFLDLLEAYYAADSDPVASQRRQASDRWFLYDHADGLTASELVERLLAVVPELSGARIERVGGSHGALVMRAGDHVCALEDEHTDSVSVISVSVRDVVRAFNVLLERQGERFRLVGLFGDGTREGYVGLPSLAAAMPLTHAHYLTAVDVEMLMELTAW